jgi:hypothetical protein
MNGTRFDVSPWRFVATLAVVFSLAACGSGSGKGGSGGRSDIVNAGGTGEGGGNAGEGGIGAMGGGEALTGGTGGSTGNSTGGTQGTASTGGAGGTASTGGASGGTVGGTATGGTMGMVDATKERVWIDADITFGPNGSITHNQPSNWFSPIDYYNGSMEVRANVTAAPSGTYGLELCLYKSGPGDAKHDCMPLAYLLKGTGEHLVTNRKSSIILRNPLAAAGVTEQDFMTPWAANNTRLVGSQHAMPIAGPVVTHLTIVLVPKGYTFSGWSKYPVK